MATPHHHTGSFRIRIEELEERTMMAAHAFNGAAARGGGLGGVLARQAPADAIAQLLSRAAVLPTDQIAARDQVFAGFGAGCSAEQHTVLTAELTDSVGTATGTVTLRTSIQGEETYTKLVVSVSGATPDSTLDVAIGETVVGQVTTDANGAGSLVLSSNPKGTQQPLPTDFPTEIPSGTAVTVGTLAGTLETAVKPVHETPAATILRAELTDESSGASATAKLMTVTVGDMTWTKLVVKVRGATADSMLDVSIGGTVVGQVSTDADGAGKLVLSSHPRNSNQQPLPADFPTDVTAGTTITVGTLAGTLETTTVGSVLARLLRRR